MTPRAMEKIMHDGTTPTALNVRFHTLNPRGHQQISEAIERRDVDAARAAITPHP